MRVLVIGGESSLGSAVARALAAAGHTVAGLRGGSSQPAPDLIEWKPGSLDDPSSLRRALEGQDAAVFAAHGGDAPASFDELHATHVVRAKLAARACLEARKRLVYSGSSAVYSGSLHPEPATEDGVPSPERFASPFARALALAEAEVLRAVAAGLDAVLLHPSLAVGPSARSLPHWLEIGARARVRVCPPGGLNLVPLDDVARAHAIALERAKRGSIYLLGGENVANRVLLDVVQSIAGRARALVSVPRAGFRALGGLSDALAQVRRSDDPSRITADRAREATLYWFVDSSKAERELGWRAGEVRPALEAQLARA